MLYLPYMKKQLCLIAVAARVLTCGRVAPNDPGQREAMVTIKGSIAAGSLAKLAGDSMGSFGTLYGRHNLDENTTNLRRIIPSPPVPLAKLSSLRVGYNDLLGNEYCAWWMP